MDSKLPILFCLLMLSSCQSTDVVTSDVDYRQEMRNLVTELSIYGKNSNKDFLIIPQNGIELIYDNTLENLESKYINAIDALAQEDLHYGYLNDDIRTPIDISDELSSILDDGMNNGLVIMAIEYCYSPQNIINALKQDFEQSYIPFIATNRELNQIPSAYVPKFNENNIETLGSVRNFLYLLNYENYASKESLIQDLKKTDYDLLILDAFFEEEIFTSDDLVRLKVKNNGKKRLVISYLSIGEAEDYRYYWKENWNRDLPQWINRENPDWPGNYKVEYWRGEWQSILYKNTQSSYLQKIINSGFDGVYLDLIDAYEFFESN